VIDISVLDSVRAFQREGTPDLVDKLVTHYLEDAAETIKALGAAVEDKNTRDTFRLAHKLKSNSAYVGAVHLSSLLTDLGALARQNEVKGAMGLFMAIEQEFESVERALAAQVRTRIASR
jgi:HPt (histidine-containing phosphotransfer) domain-containing protein